MADGKLESGATALSIAGDLKDPEFLKSLSKLALLQQEERKRTPQHRESNGSTSLLERIWSGIFPRDPRRSGSASTSGTSTRAEEAVNNSHESLFNLWFSRLLLAIGFVVLLLSIFVPMSVLNI